MHAGVCACVCVCVYACVQRVALTALACRRTWPACVCRWHPCDLAPQCALQCSYMLSPRCVWQAMLDSRRWVISCAFRRCNYEVIARVVVVARNTPPPPPRVVRGSIPPRWFRASASLTCSPCLGARGCAISHLGARAKQTRTFLTFKFMCVRGVILLPWAIAQVLMSPLCQLLLRGVVAHDACVSFCVGYKTNESFLAK